MVYLMTTSKTRLAQVLTQALSALKPTSNEIAMSNALSNQLMLRLKNKVSSNVDIIMAGSVARGTQISGNSDIDIFLLFPKTSNEREMEALGIKYAKSIVNRKNGETFKIKYSEHPYLQLISKTPPIKVDIVPAFKINDSFEMGSAVDRTQLHNIFILDHLSNEQKDDVRLLKGFLKFHSIYGAEAKTEGFSGYLCELLVYYYGSFVKVLEGISRITIPIVISPKEHLLLKKEDKNFESDFIVIDPTDDNRNVAAAVSKESLSKFIIISRKFLNKPSIDFFYDNKYSDYNSKTRLNKIRKKMSVDLYIIHFDAHDISEDILWQQAKRFMRQMQSHLEREQFSVLLSLLDISDNKGIICLFINKYEIGSKLYQGPEVFLEHPSTTFIESNSTVVFKDYRLYSIKNVQNKNPHAQILSFIRSRSEFIPTHINKKSIKISINKYSEQQAKILYKQYVQAVRF